jgi:hypothetical protein
VFWGRWFILMSGNKSIPISHFAGIALFRFFSVLWPLAEGFVQNTAKNIIKMYFINVIRFDGLKDGDTRVVNI